MARYNPSIASNAKNTEELRRSQTAENSRISQSINQNERILFDLFQAIADATDLNDLKTRAAAINRTGI